MKKLNNTETELKKSVAYKNKRLHEPNWDILCLRKSTLVKKGQKLNSNGDSDSNKYCPY